MAQQSLRISHCVINRLENVKYSCVGKLYGIFYKNILVIVGAHIYEADAPDIKYSFPTEVDQCGAFKVTHEKVKESDASKIVQEVLVTDSPLYLHKLLDEEEISAYYIINDRMQQVEYTVLSEKEIYSDIMHLRLKTKVPLICELNQEAITEAIKQLTNNMAAGLVAFNIAKTNIYILGSTNEHSGGVSGSTKLGYICDKLKQEDEQLDVKKKKSGVYEMDILLVNMFKKTTVDPYCDSVKKHAPIVYIDKRMDQMLVMALEIDALSMVYRKTNINRLYDILIESACRNLRLTQDLLLKYFDENGGDQPPLLSDPEIYHFLPEGVGHFITRVYDKKKSDTALIDDRRILHTQFLLPMTQPIFRRTNKYLFEGERLIPNKLINPHVVVKPTDNGGEAALVKGRYAYYHYCQDKMNDDGWGCAYRSLQTLASWFFLQGYSEKPVPSFKEIQTCLVDIGDKPANFIGSSQWIGSTEVNFVLSSLLGIDCKILYCSNGTEVGSYGPELVSHFKTNGSPIMIGGGVLAHTILGVDYNHETGNIKFLILDPHYTGGEDLQVIQKKGWCGWKGIEFWDKKSYYNMCLPQVPKCI